jgi:hypothetical protein
MEISELSSNPESYRALRKQQWAAAVYQFVLAIGEQGRLITLSPHEVREQGVAP